MKIKKIKIKNFMGFSPEGEEIVLDDNLSIFVGENNSGKSGIGRAIAFIQNYWKGLIESNDMDGFDIGFFAKNGDDLLENITHLSKKVSDFEIEFKLELEEPELSLITDELIKKSNQALGVKITSDNESLNKLKDSIKDITVYAVCNPPSFDIFVKLNKHKIYIDRRGLFTSNFESFKHGTSSLPPIYRKASNFTESINLDWLKHIDEEEIKSAKIEKRPQQSISFNPINVIYNYIKNLFLKNIVVFSEHRMLMKNEPYQDRQTETITGQELSSVLYNLKNHKNDTFSNKYGVIVKIFKDMYDIDLNVVHYKDGEKKIKVSKNGHSLNIEDCGAGLFENLFIITNLCNSEGKIFFIEEPEQHLHPHAQGLLIDFFEKASNLNQLLLTTHSLTFADSNHFESIHIVRWDKSTRINNIDKTKLEDSDFQKLKRELEDLSKRNIFFSRYILLVEGDSELSSFPQILRKLNFSPEKEGLLVLNCGSKYSMSLFSRFSASLNIPYFLIFDNDAFEKKVFGKILDIEDSDWKKIEDLPYNKINKIYASLGCYVLPGNFESTVKKDGFESELRRFEREVNSSKRNSRKRIVATLLTEHLIKEDKIPHHFEEALNSAITYFKKYKE